MENKKFMSINEYTKEFLKSGEGDFYEFLERKKQEALKAGNQELAEHIETIYRKDYEAEEAYFESLEEEEERKREEERKKKEELEEKEYFESLEEEEKLGIYDYGEDGEIIIPGKKTPEELESMSEEELQQIIANNEQTIEENNKVIKKALVERVLTQQRTISEQQLEISRLNSQKKEL